MTKGELIKELMDSDVPSDTPVLIRNLHDQEVPYVIWTVTSEREGEYTEEEVPYEHIEITIE